MKFHFPWRRPMRTAHIRVDTSRCAACERCRKICPANVFGMVRFGSHRHVRVDRPDDCIGCLTCVRTCIHGAIKRREGDGDSDQRRSSLCGGVLPKPGRSGATGR